MVIWTKNKQMRMSWTKARINRTLNTWNKFCSSDECSVVTGMYCWRREDENDVPNIVCPPKQRQIYGERLPIEVKEHSSGSEGH